MSLVGKNGYKIGSEEYFKDLNEKTIIGDLMKEFLYSSCSTDYKLMVEKLCDNIINTVVTIYNDLSKYASYLIFFSKSERERMSEFLKKLDDVLKLVDRGKKSEIFYSLRLLSLDDYNTKLKSRVNLSKIEEAAKRVKNGGSARISYSVGYDLIKKAVDYGVDYTVNADLTKMLFFSEVLEDKGKDFLEDLWHYLRYDKEKNTLVGRCQSVILSDSYIDKLESEIFGRAKFYMSTCGSYYKKIKDDIINISKYIKEDLIANSIPIFFDYREKLILGINNLNKLFQNDLYLILSKKTADNTSPKTIQETSNNGIIRDYIFVSQVDFYTKNERESTLLDNKNKFFIEHYNQIYPALSYETATLHHWSHLEKDFFNKTFNYLINKINVKDTLTLDYIYNESINGDLDFKTFDEIIAQDTLYLIDNLVYNRNEMGNYMWAYYLRMKGYPGYVSGLFAQGGKIITSTNSFINSVLDEENTDSFYEKYLKADIRFDEKWDQKARWNGVRKYFENSKNMSGYYIEANIIPALIILMLLISKNL